MRNPLRPVTILCVGGNDAGMGAGLQTDFAVAKSLEVHAHLAPTMNTVQTTDGLQSVELIDRMQVGRSMLDALSDGIDAVKVGALGDELIAEVVVEVLDPWVGMLPIVFDPVANASKSKPGVCLNTRAGVKLAEKRLLPMVTLATPNTIEYGSGKSYLECPAVLLKGGHADPFAEYEGGDCQDYISDLLKARGRSAVEYRHQKIPAAEQIHGTGCALSSLIACYLAMDLDLDNAVTTALRVMQEWLQAAAKGDGRLHPRPTSILPGTRFPDPSDGEGHLWI
ncbi:MAG: bifunctional hydroxymethylpyrimidine kinase/phosphomethylpyrimidine kinase [Planctomycetes bacterium]|nr:bifunctional hydroxymethylpyrimidine kinase/phosphomethylpyrimidine kinase [Planctomycetota bacterium]